MWSQKENIAPFLQKDQHSLVVNVVRLASWLFNHVTHEITPMSSLNRMTHGHVEFHPPIRAKAEN